MNKDQVPQYHEMINALLTALHDLGGSGSIGEINNATISILDLDEDVVEIPHDPDKSNDTEVEYRLAWTRTYLKKYGLIDNSSRGIWAINPAERNVREVDPGEVVRVVREQAKAQRASREVVDSLDQAVESPEEVQHWREELHQILTKELSPDAFERLTKRLLRESGFVQVEVTGRSGDGGIDGKGIVRVSGLLSFHVVFQCKRYQGSVTSSQVRDFRGAMIGRADKGLLITTGSFTRDAVTEATRDGAPPIDLINGDQLADKLKELSLGVSTTEEVVERVEVNASWFSQI
ncbi:MAG: restriction endonuclease [Bacteroidetes bacterium]|nr:restriction endonuclease [Bacteroidota bacterium]